MSFGCNSFKAWANLAVAVLCLLSGILLCLAILLIPKGHPWTELNLLGPASLGIPGALLIVSSSVPFLMFSHKLNLTSTKPFGLAWRKQSIKELILLQWDAKAEVEDGQRLLDSTFAGKTVVTQGEQPTETIAVSKTENFDESVSIPDEIPANVDDFVHAFHLDSPNQSFFPKVK